MTRKRIRKPRRQLRPDEFLWHALARSSANTFIEIRCITPDKPKKVRCEWFRITEPNMRKAVQFAMYRNGRGFGAFWGVSPRIRRGGKRVDVAEMPVIGADIDLGRREVPGQEGVPRFRTKEEALDALWSLVEHGRIPPPTFIVDSGNGLHVYWVLTEPLPVSLTGSWVRAMTRLAVLLRADMTRAKGPEIVLRVPGTKNLKSAANPKTVRLLHSAPDNSASIVAFPLATDEELAKYHGRKRSSSRKKKPAAGPAEENQVPALHLQLQKALLDAGQTIRSAADGCGEFLGTYLECCPCCSHIPAKDGGESLWSAVVTPHKMSLKCWRTYCPAHDEGLPLEQWLPECFPEVAEQLRHLLTVSVEEAEGWFLKMRPTIRAVAKEGLVPVVVSPPGVGKSSFFQQTLVADAAEGKGGTLSVPTYLLAEEAAAHLKHLAESHPQVKILVVQSYSRACAYREKMAAWGRRVPGWKRTVCRGCSHSKDCVVLNQFKGIDREHTILVVVHDNLFRVVEQEMAGNMVVVDEAGRATETERIWTGQDLASMANSQSAWAKQRHVTAQILRRTLELAKAEHDAALTATENLKENSARFGKYIHGAPLRALAEKAASELGLELPAELKYSRSIRPPRVKRKVVLEEGNAKEYPPLDFDELVDNLRKAAIYMANDWANPEFRLLGTGLPKMDAPVVALDATGWLSRGSLERAFHGKQLEFFTMKVEQSEYVGYTHYRTATYQAGRFRLEQERVLTALTADVERILAVVRDWNPDKKADPRIGVITSKSLESHVEHAFEEHGVELFEIDHFGNILGTNKFEDVEVLILLGDLHPNLQQAAYHASVLGTSRDARIWSIRRAETIQAAGRAREIRRGRDNPLLLIHVTNVWTLPQQPHQELQPPQGRPSKEETRKLEEAIGEILDRTGFAAAPLFTRSGGVGIWQLGQKWLKNNVLNNHLCPSSTISMGYATNAEKRRLRRTLKKVACARGATKLEDVPLPDGPGSMTVWEVRAGSYEAWLDNLQPGRDTCRASAQPPRPRRALTGRERQLSLLDSFEQQIDGIAAADSTAGGSEDSLEHLTKYLLVAEQHLAYYSRLCDSRSADPLRYELLHRWVALRDDWSTAFDRVALALAEGK